MSLRMIWLLAGLAIILVIAGGSQTNATSGWGCFTVQNVATDDLLMLRKSPTAKSEAIGSLHPRQHGVIAENGACKPATAPPSKQWCPVTHYNGDVVERGWARLRFLGLSECP